MLLLSIGGEMRGSSLISYRPDVDGLRAVAVLGVIGYHAAPTLVRAGYIGVDVFFVISGFLISSIILREQEAGEFTLSKFYARRVRRLFPALAVVLAATFLIGWFYLLPHEFTSLGKHMLSGAAYFINFTLKRESGYFDSAVEEKPLLHLWSLSVEEQFYIVWPLLLLLIRQPRTLMLVIAALVALSFGWGLYALSKSQASAFYLPQYRVWELGSGSLLAAIGVYRPQWLIMSSRRANFLSLLGLLLIVGPAVFIAQRAHYPGFYALLPVTGAVMLLMAGPQAVVNRALLAHPALVFVGLISYSLYLWHWPLLSFAHILGLSSDPTALAIILAASLGLAVATYFLIERPIRRVGAPMATPALIAATAIIGIGGAAAQYALLPARLNAAVHQDVSAATSDWGFPKGLKRDHSVAEFKLYRTGYGANAVLFLGDSQVEQYWPRVARLLTNQSSHRSIVFATLGGCPPIVGLHSEGRSDCNAFTQRSLKLVSDPQIGTVVISAAWLKYFDSQSYQISGYGSTIRDTRGWDEGFTRLDSLIRSFAANGKAVWLVLGTPTGGNLAPARSLHRFLSGETRYKALSIDRRSANRIWEPIRAKLREVAARAGAHTIDPFAWLCDAQVCPGRSADNAIIYMDQGHLRASYVREHAGFIDHTLELATGSVAK